MATKTPVLNQLDPRWKDLKLGFGSELTFGQSGCLLMSYSVVTGVDPIALDGRIKRAGLYYGSCGCMMATFDLTRFQIEAPSVVSISEPFVNSPFPTPKIVQVWNHVRNGGLAIARIDFTPKLPEDTMHWLTIVDGFGSERFPQLVVNDSWGGRQDTLSAIYQDTPERILVQTILYSPSSRGVGLVGDDSKQAAPAILPNWATEVIG